MRTKCEHWKERTKRKRTIETEKERNGKGRDILIDFSIGSFQGAACNEMLNFRLDFLD